MVTEQDDKTPTGESFETPTGVLSAIRRLVNSLMEATSRTELFEGDQKVMFLRALIHDSEILLELVADMKRILEGLTTREIMK